MGSHSVQEQSPQRMKSCPAFHFQDVDEISKTRFHSPTPTEVSEVSWTFEEESNASLWSFEEESPESLWRYMNAPEFPTLDRQKDQKSLKTHLVSTANEKNEDS